MESIKKAELILMGSTQKITLSSSPFVIGSYEKACDFCYNHPDMAPIHCEFVFSDGHWGVRDLNSRSGIVINGKHIGTSALIKLYDGDMISVTDLKFEFQSEEEADNKVLFSESEMNRLNEYFKNLEDNKPEDKKAAAREACQMLWNKILEVNEIGGGGMTIQDAASDYLSDIFMYESNVEDQSDEIFEEEPVEDNFENASDEAESIFIEEPMSDFEGSDATKVVPKVTPQLEKEISGASSAKPETDSFTMKDVEKSAPGDFADGNDVTAVISSVDAEHPEGFKPMILEWVNPEPGQKDVCIISKTPFVIGKSSHGVDYQIVDRGISRKHMEIDYEDGTYYVVDLNSTNGVQMNGQFIQPDALVPLIVGDILTIGRREYRFERV